MSTGSPCPSLTAPVVRTLAKGERVDIGDGAVTITAQWPTGPTGVVTLGNVLFRSSRVVHTLVSVLGRLTVTIAPAPGHRSQLC